VLKEAREFRRALLAWYRREARDLPWRRSRDPYHVWLSEILLQQTRVDQALPYYLRFLEAFPSVHALAAAPPDRVLKLWEGLGYYTRARNLHRAAKVIARQYGGQFPRSPELLQLLPGVGPYTACAVASIAFDRAAPVVDGNVKRVLARLYDIEDAMDRPATGQKLWTLAGGLVPRTAPGDFNQAMMELGARVCTPKRPGCALCPVAACCRALRAGTVELRPVRGADKARPHHEVVVAVIARQGKFLVGKRPPAGLLGGLWEFPGGKVNAGESHEQALLRECREELGIEVRPGGLIACVRHAYTHFRVTLNVYRCALVSGRPHPRSHTELRWVRSAEFSELAFPKANHKFLHLL